MNLLIADFLAKVDYHYAKIRLDLIDKELEDELNKYVEMGFY